jgi:hypothetical protein
MLKGKKKKKKNWIHLQISQPLNKIETISWKKTQEKKLENHFLINQIRT